MPRSAARAQGRPSGAHAARQNHAPQLDETRSALELHLPDLANQHVPEGHPDDFETTDEYDEEDDGAGNGEILSDEEDARHWGARQRSVVEGEHYGDLEGDLDVDVDIHDEEGAPTEEYEYEEMEDTAPIFDPAALGLKEINNLAHFSVSSHKPGNGVAELLSDDLEKYWQSDGQQPHLLTMHFLRRVEIRALRFFVDHTQDESYTPIHILWYAGTGHHDLMQFGEQVLSSPSGWQDVKIEGLGGGSDGNSLCCYIVQMHVKENHQNGKDTHIRGIKIYATDENAPRVNGSVVEAGIDGDPAVFLDLPTMSARGQLGPGVTAEDLKEGSRLASEISSRLMGRFNIGGMALPDFMREPEIR